MLITQSYRALNRALHAGGQFGLYGDKWADQISGLVERYGAVSILDYGCGQGSLGRALGPIVREYDPAISGKDGAPVPADLVVCTDVLEHIEPECLPDVLAHLYALSRTACFVVIATRPAQKLLADGRNAHLIVEDDDFWRERLLEHFTVREWVPLDREFAAVLEPLRGVAALRGLARKLRREWFERRT
ncbi:class I SAM-dependent methyltransferase [Novosphingobium aerophilum]|uniref:Class I SAM-dependent methyltransferase n=1 Tax=Novosphingobium aerophilum TaxID=2839843 RepID=A0A7X1F704_9SPHN|nr:hypothetical protein [Novosphingobium aerophilum]MBC2651533.1 hypothetical protein [Novosphingobium aerophilum]